MEKKKIVNQMIDVHKKAFDDCFSTILTLQNQAAKLVKTFVDHVPGMSDEGKKVIDQCTDSYNKGIDDLKKAIDEGYAKVEAFLSHNEMIIFKEHVEKMFNAFSNQGNWMPQHLNNTMEKLVANYKNGNDEFKKYVDDNIWCIKYFSPVFSKPQTHTEKQTKAKTEPKTKPKTKTNKKK
jgi:hypothetical protein